MSFQSIGHTLGKCGLAHVTKRVTKTVFWRIGFHMCADRPRKHWRKSSRRRGFWRYCDCYCETAHWLVWTDSMKERERMVLARRKSRGWRTFTVWKFQESTTIQILDIFGHFGYWPKSISATTQVVSFHLQQFFLFFGKSKLNWCCWCYMWVAQCSSLVYPLQSSLQHKLEGRGELLPEFSLAAYLESCNIRDSLVKIAKSVSISMVTP